MSQTLLIYNTEILPFTQTFTLSQTDALKTFLARYVGLGPARNSLLIPSDSILLTYDNSLASRVQRNAYKLLGIAPEFHRRVRQAHGRLIHVHFLENGAIGFPLLSELDLPVVLTLHGSIECTPDRALRKSIIGNLYLLRRQRLHERVSLFLCVSKSIYTQALQAGLPKEKLRLHYIGIDCNLFSPGDAAREKDLVLFVGRLAEIKGCKYLIQAMHDVQRALPQARLVIIGDGPLRNSLEALADRLNVRCNFLGAKPVNEVRSWLGRATVLCAPSVTTDGHTEALGMVFIEAQASGVPVVSFLHGGIPEAVCHGKTGLLAPERDYDMLAEYILRYLTDDAFRQASSRQAVEWARYNFDLENQTRKLEQIYEEVLSRT